MPIGFEQGISRYETTVLPLSQRPSLYTCNASWKTPQGLLASLYCRYRTVCTVYLMYITDHKSVSDKTLHDLFEQGSERYYMYSTVKGITGKTC